MNPKIRILVVDDSAFMRKMITEILNADPAFEVVGTARDGRDAVQKVHELSPDVVTMDVEMPFVSGDEALTQIMKEKPTPVVMLSSLTQAGAQMSLRCLAAGAIDVVGKPSGSTSLDIKNIADEITAKVKAASKANLRAIIGTPKSPSITPLAGRSQASVILIGCSTGGPKALQTLIPMIPKDLGIPIVIVQHMPPQFTASLAARLDSLSQIRVKEAEPGDRLVPNLALVAPGGVHLKFTASGAVELSQEPPVHGVRPSIDVTISSMIQNFGRSMLGVLLTGMGRDGAVGLKAIRDLGGHTIAEHESTCVVYGMPKTAVEMGAAEQILPLDQIAVAIQHLTRPASVRHIA